MKVYYVILVILIMMTIYDYLKNPIDKLYFQNPKRILLGIRNTIIDIFMYKKEYCIEDYGNLKELKENFAEIKREFEERRDKVMKYYYHNDDEWFEKTDNYYYYKAKDFPKLKRIIEKNKYIVQNSGKFAIMKGDMIIPAHRAESNLYLRYHLTIEGNGDCVLNTENGDFVHKTGNELLFDHSRYHEVKKKGKSERITLILDVKRVV